MSTLHTVNKSPFATDAMLSCLNHCVEGDAVLMIEDGVYGAVADSRISTAVEAKAGIVKLFVLGPDAEARGLSQKICLSDVGRVDYDGFVDLVSQHDRTQAWL